MPDIPASVQITRLIVGALLALAVLAAATAGLLTHNLAADAFGGLVAGALAVAGVGAVASTRKRRMQGESGTTYAEPFDPAKRLTDAEGRSLRAKVDSEDPTPRGGTRRGFSRRGPLVALAFTLGALVLAPLAGALLHGCSGEQRVAQTTIVAMGGSVSAIHEAHRDAYVEATDALRAEVRAQHGTIADYDRGVVPIDRAFRARSEALQSLSASLYAAAAIVDAHERGAPASQYAPAAVDVLRALERVLDVLDHGEVIPRVPIPSEVRTTMRALEAVALAGGALLSSPADAGTDGGAQ